MQSTFADDGEGNARAIVALVPGRHTALHSPAPDFGDFIGCYPQIFKLPSGNANSSLDVAPPYRVMITTSSGG